MRPTTIQLIPRGGLDFDGNPFTIEPTDYTHAENFRNSVSYEGRQFVPCNMKGNVLVAYNMGTASTLCIGSCEDKQNSILYFIWSSDNKHKILRYFPGRIDNANPYGVIHLIMEFDFGWTSDTRITGADLVDQKLLFWTDNVKPRKINIEKADITNKIKTWEVYLPITTSGSDTFNIFVRNIITGIAVDFITVTVTGTREQKFAQLETIINTDLSAFITAESCDCKLKITESRANLYNVQFTNTDYKVVPDNWYGISLLDRFFDACKWPPGCDPKPEYKQDSTINFNYVKERVFYWRLGYEYDDFEESTLGPISNTIVNNQLCNESLYESFNYIDIDFNDSALLDPRVMVILKKVGVYVKQHNSGLWRKVRSLEVCDFYDLVSSAQAAHYKFYNDVNTSAVALTVSNPLYSDNPRTAAAQRFVNNKLTYAGIKTGYDAPDCVESALELTFGDVGQQEYFDVEFIIRICNRGFDGSVSNPDGSFKCPYHVGFSQILNSTVIKPLNKRGCILRNPDESYPVWGGASYEDVSTNQIGFAQQIPLGGFLVYLAGTSLYGISRQIPLENLSVDEFGALLTEGSKSDEIKAYLNKGNTDVNEGDVYHVVTIKNVPKGKYIARVASHLVSDGDILNAGKIYDRRNGLYHLTSTNVFRIQDSSGNWLGATEVAIDVSSSQNYGEIFIADSMVPNFSESQVHRFVYGYLVDAPLINVQNTVVKSIGMENQTVVYTLLGPWNGAYGEIKSATSIGPGTSVAGNSATQTDHNGYFFFSSMTGALATVCYLAAIGANDQIITPASTIKYLGSIGQVYDSILLALADLPDPNDDIDPSVIINYLVPQQSTGAVDITQVNRQVIIQNTNSDYRRDYSTVVKGKTVDSNGNPVCCINAVLTKNGRPGRSQTDGDYTILAFAIGSHGVSLPAGPLHPFPVNLATMPLSAVQGDVYFNSDDCPADLPNNPVHVDANPLGQNPNDSGTPYSSTSWYAMGNILCSLINGVFIKSAKRGGKYEFSLRYQDDSGRLCSCVKAAEIYIPFFGEDLNKYFPAQYAPGSYSDGYPIIKWTLDPNFKPPVWAVKYQWLRTRVLNMSDYLQWVINDVKYVIQANESGAAIETDYTSFSATQIWISIDNLQEYLRQNPRATISYQFVVGQRLRFITDGAGKALKQYVDMVITGQQDTFLKLDYFDDLGEIKTGMVIELYNPKKEDELDIFYEVGACYPCTAPGTEANDHSVKTANFEWGDTYWVKRKIPIRDTTDVVIISDAIRFVESKAISDFYSSTDEDLGRVGSIDIRFREQNKYTAFRVSETYLPDTGINGLNKFLNIDDVELGKEFGPIRKLVSTGYVLGAVCENKFVSNYLGATMGVNPENENIILSSQQGFIGDSRPLLGDFGTQHPATVVEKDGHAIGIDFSRGVAWMYNNNGLDEIQRYKARNFFRAYRDSGVWDAVAGIDRYYNEYILTVWGVERLVGRVSGIALLVGGGANINIRVDSTPNISQGDKIRLKYTNINKGNVVTEYFDVKKVVVLPTIPATTVITVFLPNGQMVSTNATINVEYRGSGKTIAYQLDKKRWTTFYRFVGDCLAGVGMDFVAWKNGQLYLHDKGPIGTFFGVFYPWKLRVVSNLPAGIKTWDAMYLDQLQDPNDRISNWSIPTIVNELGQLSRLIKSKFQRLEQYWHTAFGKDLNTTSVNNPIVNGRDLRSETLTLDLENDATDIVELRSVNLLVKESSGNTR